MAILTDKEFVKNLSEADMDKAEAIEAEIHAALLEGFTEDIAFTFVRAVIALQEAVPGATVWGIFATALRVGLVENCRKVCAGDRLPAMKKTRKGALSGAGV